MADKNTSYAAQAFEQSMTKVYDAQQRIAALHYSLQELRKDWGRYRERPAADDQFGLLHQALYQKLNDAYRDVFMWGAVSGDAKLLAKARAVAFEHYLTDNSSIMEYLGFSYGSSIPVELEKQFRAELNLLKERAK